MRVATVAVMACSLWQKGGALQAGQRTDTGIERHPKYELRGVWVASVGNIDWPSSGKLTSAQQRQEFLSLANAHAQAGFNALFVQIRPDCDALYASDLEPWSEWLTGEQGRAPDPYYDPLPFMIEVAHELNMEFHAWFNPYRAIRDVRTSSVSPTHVTRLHPEWVVNYSTAAYLDPGLPDVRDYVTKVVCDIVGRYDVDGLHSDDFFAYPYPEANATFNDEQTFEKYSRGFTDKAAWRRDNINILVKQIQSAVRALKPYVKYTLSPFGIWKNNTPPGVTGFSSYDGISCDSVSWLNDLAVDALVPQTYWVIGGPQDFNKLMPWWGEKGNGRHIYVGLAAYRLAPNVSDWSQDEITSEIKSYRANANISGSVFFSSKSLTDDLKGIETTLGAQYFNVPALPPPMPWKGGRESIAPPAVQKLQVQKMMAGGSVEVTWEMLQGQGDVNLKGFVVYRVAGSRRATLQDLNDPRNIAALVPLRSGQEQYSFKDRVSIEGASIVTYIVTALDRLSTEGPPSRVQVMNGTASSPA